mmetsp:Transcript_11961/g.35282  ORF Transcript_11961/g.35282 Transcript_11961/m.35282 type:complete len:104 (-) Transcript_11961:92-403(-)
MPPVAVMAVCGLAGANHLNLDQNSMAALADSRHLLSNSGPHVRRSVAMPAASAARRLHTKTSVHAHHCPDDAHLCPGPELAAAARMLEGPTTSAACPCTTMEA